MNHKLWNSVGARVIADTFVLAGVAACDRNSSDVTSRSVAASPSAQVVGTNPATPTGDPAGTTPIATSSEVSKPVETRSMPLPGQANDHSNLAAKPSQNAQSQDVLKSTATAANANSGPPQEERK